MIARFSIGITLFFLLYGSAAATPKNYFEKIFTVKDDLPENNVTSLLCDHRGLIWLGMNNGLACFDGYTFKVFHHDLNDSTSLSDTRITSIVEGKLGNIWVGTYYGGLNRYDPMSQRFRHYALPVSKINGISYQQVTDLLVDATGRLWIGAYNGLYYFDPSKNKLIEFILDSSITVKNYYNWVLNLHSDARFLYAETNHGSAAVDYRSLKSYYKSVNPLHLEILDEKNPVSFTDGDSGKIYYWRKNSQTNNFEWCSYDSRQNLSTVLLSNADSLYRLDYNFRRFDPQHFLCFSPVGNFYLLSCPGGTLENFQLNDLRSSANVWITRTCNGANNIWCRTSAGLHLFSEKATAFQVLNATKIAKAPVPFPAIDVLFLSSDHQLWICSNNHGIAVMDTSFRQSHFFYNEIFSDRSYNYIWRAYEDRIGKIWIGRQCGYSIYDPKDNSMKDFFFERNDNTGNNFYVASSFLQTDDSTIWIGSNKGLANADVRNGKVRKWLVYDPAHPKFFPVHRVINMIPDELNHYWLMSDEGLFSFDPVTEQFKTLQETIGASVHPELHGLLDVSAVNHQLLIGMSSGFGTLNLDNRQLRIYSYSDGLPDENIWSVTPENDSTCWLVTFSGLSRFDMVHSTFTNFNYKDGLPSFENEFSNLLKLPDGEFLITTDSSLIRFNPADIIVSPRIPAVAITQFNADDQSLFIPDDSLQSIQLSWKNQVIRIQFSTLQFNDADLAQYQYRLAGLENNWNNSFTRNSVNYSNLSSGKYHFEVRAGYGNGVWGKPTSLSIEIENPFWKTWWFSILAGMLLLSIPGLILWNIISNQHAKILQQEKLNLERQRISSELHDDIGSALTKIALMGRAFQNDPEKNKNLLLRMTSSADAMIDQMNEIIWALNIRNDTLQNLLAYLRKYASDFLEGKFELQIVQPEQIPDIEISGEVRRNIFLVVKEALHNVMKHSNAASVKLIFSISNELRISIDDDGCGIRDEKRNAFGNGMLNMQQRMEQIRGSFKMRSPDGKGTKIQIQYPLQ